MCLGRFLSALRFQAAPVEDVREPILRRRLGWSMGWVACAKGDYGDLFGEKLLGTWYLEPSKKLVSSFASLTSQTTEEEGETPQGARGPHIPLLKSSSWTWLPWA